MSEKTLLEYWFVIYSRKWIVLIIVIASILTAVVLSKTLSPVYEAKAVFFVPQIQDNVTFFTPPGETSARKLLVPRTNEDMQGPYIGILKSKAIAELVHKDFPSKSVQQLMRQDTDYVLSNEYMLQVYARDKDPVVAAGVANAYVKYFNVLMSGYSNKGQLQKSETILSELNANRKNLLEARTALKTFQEKNNTADLKEETRQLISLKTTFEAALEKARIELTEVGNKIASTEEELATEMSLLQASEVTVTSPQLQRLRDELVDIESKISELKVEFREAHPSVKSLTEKHNTVQANIDKEVERIITSQIKAPDSFFEVLRRQLIIYYIDKERISAAIEADRRSISRIDERIEKIPALEARFAHLAERVEKYRKLIEPLETNLQEATAQSNRIIDIAVIVEEATPPGSPSFPLLTLNAIVALLAGLAGGISYCFFIDYLENTREKRIYRLLKAMRASEDRDG